MSEAEARGAARAVIDALSPTWLAPAHLQPAGLYLELSGEDIRRRAFLVDDHAHGELCLRPDMTVPAVRMAYALAPVPSLIAYEGLVFRKQAEGSLREVEFVQTGAEWLSATEPSIEEDAAIIACAIGAARAAGAAPLVTLGDTAIMGAFIEALGLAGPWRERVARAAARPGGLGQLRSAIVTAQHSHAASAALAHAPEEEAEAALAEILALARITPVGARPLSEIAERLKRRGVAEATQAPSAAQIDLIEALAAINAPDGLAQAKALARSPLLAGDAAMRAVARAEARHAALAARVGLEPQTRFAPGLGRTLSYYDGFIFELEAPTLGERASLGGGGRYDGLARALWGGAGALTRRAAGFALRPARLAEAKR